MLPFPLHQPHHIQIPTYDCGDTCSDDSKELAVMQEPDNENVIKGYINDG